MIRLSKLVRAFSTTAFKVQNPAFEEVVKKSFLQQTFMTETLHACLETVKPGYIEISCPFNPLLCQQHGFLHAGVTFSIGDNASGYSAMTLFPPHHAPLISEAKINLLSPAVGDSLIAKATVIKPGRTLTTVSFECLALTKGKPDKLCAVGMATIFCNTPEKGLKEPKT